jgi:hypothetical protein
VSESTDRPERRQERSDDLAAGREVLRERAITEEASLSGEFPDDLVPGDRRDASNPVSGGPAGSGDVPVVGAEDARRPDAPESYPIEVDDSQA